MRVAEDADETADAVAVNPMVVALAGTVTVGGTETATLLLPTPTLKPPSGAEELNVTEQVSAPAPMRDPLVHEKAVSTGAGVEETGLLPWPCRRTVVVGTIIELLLMTRFPESVDAPAGR